MDYQKRLIILEKDIITLQNDIYTVFKGQITVETIQNYEDYLNTLHQIKQGESKKKWISKYDTFYWPTKYSILDQKISNIYMFRFRLK